MTGRRSVIAVATVLMLVAVVVGALVVLGRSESEKDPSGANEAAALVAARRTAIAFFTLDPENVAKQVDAVLDLASGKFEREYSAQRAVVIKNVQDRKRAVSSQVPTDGLAIASFDPAKAVVLVAINVTTKESTRVPAENEYRLRLTLNRTGSRWTTSTLDQLAGVPGPGEFEPGTLRGGGTAIVAASAEALSSMLSYDYKKLDEDLESTLPLLTRSFSADFARTFDATVRPLATEKKSVTAAYVRAAGLVVRNGDKARTLVFVDQVLNPDDSADVTESRLFVDLRRVKGTWLVDGLNRA
ncbi:hypothetical protein ABIE44_001601 [Marmoricola sp. OAE513]|uniref:hypothetical protein n=1 Tax=Marmoricola sp. OAE513 TaxID=2817894 RepID=UPI001AE64565